VRWSAGRDWPSIGNIARKSSRRDAAENPAYIIYIRLHGERKADDHSCQPVAARASDATVMDDREDRHPMHNRSSFASVPSSWRPSAPASVVIATSDQMHDPLALFELMKEHDVTIWASASMAHVLTY